MLEADLRTPNQFRDYFMGELGAFMGQEIPLSLPSQEHVDLGQRIKDAGFSKFEPVAFPNLQIEQGFIYPPRWEFPLNHWIYEKITAGDLTSDDLVLTEEWGWLDTSVRLDWKISNPMFDEDMDKPLANLLLGLREKGVIGIPPPYLRDLDPRSPFGVSADDIENSVYPALARLFGVKREGLRSLKAVEFNFVGNWFYRHLGEANSWEWLHNKSGVGHKLVGGHNISGGLSSFGRYPTNYPFDYISFRPLIVSSSKADNLDILS